MKMQLRFIDQQKGRSLHSNTCKNNDELRYTSSKFVETVGFSINCDLHLSSSTCGTYIYASISENTYNVINHILHRRCRRAVLAGFPLIPISYELCADTQVIVTT